MVRTRKRRIRCAAQVRRNKVVQEYLKEKEEYEKMIMEAKTESWRNFCTRQEREGMWQGIYRVVNHTTKRVEDIPLIANGKYCDSRESAMLLAETFYPPDEPSEDTEEQKRVRADAEGANDGSRNNDIQDPPFTNFELERAVNSFNPKRHRAGTV
ncbi:unnamed protein product [Pieris macdunnoughi]|uniref:Uncharacterized protein n=1 Tax=Pieris macdunnoughi TaxID=345717 RepID=A0A821XYA5_9NEOP|nr:unnamed protein product [Pieris macdunnoughi]